jgi:hypothetical protein
MSINEEGAGAEGDLENDGKNIAVATGFIFYTGRRRNPEGKSPHGRPCVRKELLLSRVSHTICCQLL